MMSSSTQESKDTAEPSLEVPVELVRGPTPQPKLPDIPPTEEEAKELAKGAGKSEPAKAAAAPPTVDEFEALRKRFEALKQR